jgi:hypothetical protein
MALPDRRTLVGMALGALGATFVATIGPGAMLDVLADEMVEPTGIDLDKLVFFEGKPYTVEHEDWVATEPLSTTRVKKVEAGRVSYVTITTTATGTYSTDAMFSRHVQYPGIAVEDADIWNHFGHWHDGHWHHVHAPAANSFYYVDAGDTAVMGWGNTTCVAGPNYMVC